MIFERANGHVSAGGIAYIFDKPLDTSRTKGTPYPYFVEDLEFMRDYSWSVKSTMKSPLGVKGGNGYLFCCWDKES